MRRKLSRVTNFVCVCGLCCGNLIDWLNHSKVSHCQSYTIKSVAEITKGILNQIENIPKLGVKA